MPVFGWAKQIVVADQESPIYESEKPESGEKPLYSTRKGEWLEVVSQKDNIFKLSIRVRTQNGKTGWIQKSLVKALPAEVSEKFTMDEAKVLGFLENPQAVYILDMSDPNFRPIRLEYSFRDLIIEDIDMENFQMVHDGALKPQE